jgi:hypothetical protein
MKFDVERILQAIAPSNVRGKWEPNYTDEGMHRLLEPWYPRQSKLEGEPAIQNSERAKGIAGKLALFTLRRDERSVIRGGAAMYDYVKDSKRHEEPLRYTVGDREVDELKRIYEELWVKKGVLSSHFNDKMRCLVYAKRYARWNSKGIMNDPLIAPFFVMRATLLELLSHDSDFPGG